MPSSWFPHCSDTAKWCSPHNPSHAMVHDASPETVEGISLGEETLSRGTPSASQGSPSSASSLPGGTSSSSDVSSVQASDCSSWSGTYLRTSSRILTMRMNEC
eukprot:EG_transcript_35855